MAQWSITTPPATTPVDVDEAAAQARIDSITADIDWLTDAITDATSYAETSTQLSLITRTITAVYYPEKANVLPEACPIPPYTQLQLFRGPVQSITSVTDRYGNAMPFDVRVVGNVHFVQLVQSTVAPVQIVYVAGYGDDPTDIPGDIRRAILAHVSHMYKYREAEEDSVPVGASSVYDRYQSGGLG